MLEAMARVGECGVGSGGVVALRCSLRHGPATSVEVFGL